MKDVILNGLKTFGQIIIVSLISFFLVISVNALKVGVFSEDIGYKVYGTKSGTEKAEYLYTYYYSEEDDTNEEKYVNDGYELLKYSIRSEIQPSAEIVLSIISQAFCLMILTAFIYYNLWSLGNKDLESERLHGTSFNKFKGLYVGLVANIPSFLMLIYFVLTKFGIGGKTLIAIYNFANCYAFDILKAVSGDAQYFNELGALQISAYFAVLLIVPVIAMISYIIGHKDISLAEKFIYKNSKKVLKGDK